MKNILIAAALLALPVLGRAQNNVNLTSGARPISNQADNTTSILRSSITCGGLSVSQSAGTDVIGSTATAHSFVTVQNLDMTANVYCSENSAVATSGVLRGFKITPGAAVTFTLPLWIKFYCINDGSGSINSVICKGY